MSRDYGHLEPGRYIVDEYGRATKSSARKQVLQGYCCHYGVEHTNYKKGRQEIFLKGCFTGSTHDCIFIIDHVLSSKPLGEQSVGTLQLIDSDEGLSFRLHLKDDGLKRLDGRNELSVGYVEVDAQVRADGVRLIKHAVLFEISGCYVGAVRQTFSEVRDANKVGTLADDSKHFAYDGAAIGFTRALLNLQ